MADRVEASITIGGTLSSAQIDELIGLIEYEGLALEWDGPPPARTDLPIGDPLKLYAREVAWGLFGRLEQWCRENVVCFVRWSGSCPGSWGAERVVFSGKSEPKSFDSDDNGHVVISRCTVQSLGTLEAIFDYFDDADFAVPPLIVADPSP